MTGLILLAYGVAILTSLLVVPLVPTIFGSAYAAASDVLLIQVWCGVFLVYAQTSGAWLMAERKAKQNLYRNVSGLCINFSANWILIPRYGATGAAAGTLLSFACAYFLYDMIAPSMRPMARIKVRAMFLLGIFEKLRGPRPV